MLLANLKVSLMVELTVKILVDLKVSIEVCSMVVLTEYEMGYSSVALMDYTLDK